MKARAWAPINLALIKYWGKVDEKLRIPANPSLSVCLSRLGTETEVEFSGQFSEDKVMVNGLKMVAREKDRVVKQLDRVRQMATIDWKARVRSENNFASKAGLSSSASGLAALSLAASKAAGLNLSIKDLSILARKGSGSACRSIADGWVEWVRGRDDKSSWAKSLWPAGHWDLRILVVVMSKKAKEMSSTSGMHKATTSYFFRERLRQVNKRMKKMKTAIKEKDFTQLGILAEEDCLSMHAVMLTQKPSLIYWLPATVRIIRAVKKWRQSGLETYFSINTGQNVFVLVKKQDVAQAKKRLERLEGVIEVVQEKVGPGARII